MDVSSIGSLSTALSETATGNAAATLVLKKAMQIAESNAVQLIEALPPVPSNPPGMGGNVDIKV